jgi:Rad3-related DNA helicase
MARALKTFCYSDGFHVWTVAAPSRAKALAAFGVKRDLFRDGSAKEIESGPDRDAALQAPGELIERGLAVDIGEVARTAATPKPKSNAAVRKRVEALERELDALDQTHAREIRTLAERQAALAREADALDSRHSRARDALKSRLKAARAKLS